MAGLLNFGGQGRRHHRQNTTGLRDASFVVLDTELTGLNERKDSIVSLGAVRMSGTRIYLGDPFYRLVRPRTALTRESVIIHGIMPSDVAEEQDIASVLAQFIGLLRRRDPRRPLHRARSRLHRAGAQAGSEPAPRGSRASTPPSSSRGCPAGSCFSAASRMPRGSRTCTSWPCVSISRSLNRTTRWWTRLSLPRCFNGSCPSSNRRGSQRSATWYGSATRMKEVVGSDHRARSAICEDHGDDMRPRRDASVTHARLNYLSYGGEDGQNKDRDPG